MHLEFSGPLFEWRGPAPYHFVAVPEDEAEQIQETAAAVTYGWGMIPVRGRIGDTDFTTSLWPRDGGYVVPVKDAVRKPEGLSFSQAAGYPVAYLTAYVGLVRCGRVQPGEWVLVHGAAGGVGLAAVDLARLLGAKVIAASASDAKLAIVEREYRPDAIVNVTGGFREQVKAVTGGKGADVIYDPVGGDVFDESLRCIAFGGRILSIGFTSGRLPVLPVNIALIKGFSVHGVRAGEYGRQNPEKGRENNAAIWKLAEEGRVKPRVDAEYPLSGWREAFETLAQRKVVGKTVIRPDL